jgi:ribosomal protein L22
MSNFIEDVSSSDDDSASQLTQATARFIVFFAKQSRQIQQQYVMSFYRSAYQYWSLTKEQKQSSLFSQHHYQIPVLCDPENGFQLTETVPYVCRSAMHLITGKKVSF